MIDAIGIKRKVNAILGYAGLAVLAIAGTNACAHAGVPDKEPVDYVNRYMGNISHLLVPTYPTVHLPNVMSHYEN